jgi:hypothetical protein
MTMTTIIVGIAVIITFIASTQYDFVALSRRWDRRTSALSEVETTREKDDAPTWDGEERVDVGSTASGQQEHTTHNKHTHKQKQIKNKQINQKLGEHGVGCLFVELLVFASNRGNAPPTNVCCAFNHHPIHCIALAISGRIDSNRVRRN